MKPSALFSVLLMLVSFHVRSQILPDPCPPVPVCVGGTTSNCLASLISIVPLGTWSSSNTSVATVNSSGIITGVSGGTATISYASIIPIVGLTIYRGDVTVYPPPTAAPSYVPVCVGDTLFLSANDTGGNSYLWSGPSSFTSTERNPSILGVTAAETGTYSLSVTSPAGCVGSYSVSVSLLSYTLSVHQTAPFILPDDKVHTYSSAGFTLQAVTTPAMPATGVTYAWSGTISASSDSSTFSPVLASSVAASYPYTVTASYEGCSATVYDTIVVPAVSTPYDYFSVNGYRTQKGLASLSSCSDCGDVLPFHTIISGSLNAGNIVDGDNYYIVNSAVCSKPALTDNVFFMGDSTHITVDSLTSVTIDHCHFFSKGWRGIIVHPGLTGTGHLRIINNTLIENATQWYGTAYDTAAAANLSTYAAGVKVWPTAGINGYYTAGMQDILESNGAIYNANFEGIALYNYQPSLTAAPAGTRLPFTIQNSVFVQREFASADTGTSSSNNFPFAWPSATILRTVTDTINGKVPVAVVNSYQATYTPANAILARNVGSSRLLTAGTTDNPAVYEYNYLHIGCDTADAALANTNLIDSFFLACYLSRANVKFFNNTFRNTLDRAVYSVYQYGDLQVAGSRADNTNNRFYNCTIGIAIGGSYPATAWDFSCKNTDFICTQHASLANGSIGIYAVLDGSHNTHTISGNNIEKYAAGLISQYLGGSYGLNIIEEKGYSYFRNNTISGKVSTSDDIENTRYGINLSDLRVSSNDSANGSVYIDSNSITGYSEGIYVYSVGQRVNILDNEVKMYGFRAPVDNLLYGIGIFRTPYLKQVKRNTVSGIGYNCYETHPTTGQPKWLSGIELRQVGNAINMADISCNLVQDLNYGFSFHHDTSVLQWTKNEMRRCKFGLYSWSGVVFGTQGSACTPADNRWTGDVCTGTCSTCSEFPGWGAGGTASLVTYLSAKATASPIYVRYDSLNSTEYVPKGNLALGVPLSTRYAYGNGTLIMSTDECDDEPVTCGPVYVARDAAIVSTVKTAAAHAVNMELFPNPATGSITVTLAGMAEEIARFRIINTVGEEVYTETLMLNKGSAILDLSMLPSGMYIVQATDMTGNIAMGRVYVNR